MRRGDMFPGGKTRLLIMLGAMTAGLLGVFHVTSSDHEGLDAALEIAVIGPAAALVVLLGYARYEPQRSRTFLMCGMIVALVCASRILGGAPPPVAIASLAVVTAMVAVLVVKVRRG